MGANDAKVCHFTQFERKAGAVYAAGACDAYAWAGWVWAHMCAPFAEIFTAFNPEGEKHTGVAHTSEKVRADSFWRKKIENDPR